MGICFDKDQAAPIFWGERIDPSPLKNSRSLIIFVVGGPGVGKSTLCKRLTAKYGLVLIWLSNILREEVASGSERGLHFKHYMAQGKIIPADVIVQLVVRKMLEHPNAHGYLVVGFPRHKKQAVLFNSEVRQPDLLIYLYARRVILQNRMEERAARMARFDDTPDAVCNRVIQYYTNVKGAMAPNKSVTKVIDAETDMETVHREACRFIEVAALTLSKES